MRNTPRDPRGVFYLSAGCWGWRGISGQGIGELCRLEGVCDISGVYRGKLCHLEGICDISDVCRGKLCRFGMGNDISDPESTKLCRCIAAPAKNRHTTCAGPLP